MTSKQGFSVVENKATRSADIYIYDEIGPAWAGMVDAKSVILALKDMGSVENIDVHINSVGGSAFECLGIYNSLKSHSASVTVHIDGIALSAASVVAMAGDVINIAENGLIMIHAPATVAFGSAADMRKTADMLDQVNDQIVSTYVARTGGSQADIAKMVADETWMNSTEAVAKGFATNIVANKAVSASFDTTKFSHCPDWARVAMSGMTSQTKEVPEMTTPVVPPATTATEMQVASLATAVPGVTVNVSGQSTTTSPVDTAAIEHAAIAKERTRISEIQATCKLAGDPEAAVAFITGGMSAQDVKNRMFDVLCSQRPPVGPNGHGPTTMGDVPDGEAKYKAEYEANKVSITNMGVTEEQYILSRKKSAGA